MYKKILMDNGIRIVYEKIPYVRSVSTGVWIGTGSRNESIKNNGISHFIEHMLFKGTSTRTAKEIAVELDSIGGQLNAFTGKEITCYYAKTLDSHIEKAFDVLSDMIFNSKFDKKDMEIEKRVVLEEINMYEDSPEEMVHDMLTSCVWGDNPLGYGVLGTKEVLASLDRNNIKEYMDIFYTPYNTVIAVAGNFDEKQLISFADKYFGSWKSRKNDMVKPEKPVFKAGRTVKKKETEQVHMCIGYNGIEHGCDDLYPLLAVNNILGGGMSSRLFQNIREKQGLVYSIFSYPSAYKDTGLFVIYAGMNPENTSLVEKLAEEEIDRLINIEIKEERLNRSKEQLKGSYILGLESTSSRMNSIGKSELLLDKIRTPEQILKIIDKISMEDIKRVIEKVFIKDNKAVGIIGMQ